MRGDKTSLLMDHGINPSAQRVAVAQYVLHTDEHPSADEVWTRVRKRFPHVSRATIYNTLNLFVEKGLLRQFVLTEGRVVFDPCDDLGVSGLDQQGTDATDEGRGVADHPPRDRVRAQQSRVGSV